MLLALTLLALAQAPAEGDAPAPAAEASPAATTPAPEDAPPAPASAQSRNNAEVQRLVKRAKEAATPEERNAILQEVFERFANPEGNSLMPPVTWDTARFLSLPPQEQASLVARSFLEGILTGDGRTMMAVSGLPFALEDRRVDRLDDLRNEWARILRSRRADLLTLYSIDVLTPAEMEKKYGRPPQRLSRWDFRRPNTYLAVANLSGHAAVLMLRQAGVTWQVVGFHD